MDNAPPCGSQEIPILRADCYGCRRDIFESEIPSKTSEASERSSHEGRNHVLQLVDQFKHTGFNGDHVCFVFDVLGHHLDFQSAKYEDGKQLLLGLDFLHRECGTIQADLKPTNILLQLGSPDNAAYQYLSEVPARTLSRQGTATPLREVSTTPLVSETTNPHIRIINFGVGRNNHLSDLIQSPALRAPEVTIDAPLGSRMIEILGPFPRHFLQQGGRADIPIFIDFIKGMLAIDPASRKSAAALLEHEWIRLKSLSE
ncbi:kinase-like domain-containing protein [Aspergillus floccosus]